MLAVQDRVYHARPSGACRPACGATAFWLFFRLLVRGELVRAGGFGWGGHNA